MNRSGRMSTLRGGAKALPRRSRENVSYGRKKSRYSTLHDLYLNCMDDANDSHRKTCYTGLVLPPDILSPGTGCAGKHGQKSEKKRSIAFFSLRMLVAEHKHPVMPTKNRLREFFVGDACALTCSGMVGKRE